MYSYRELLTLVEDEIANLKWDSEHQSLYEPIKYILNIGGKRVRPVLALMAIDMLGLYPKHFLQPVLGLEVFHNFTLLHDDLMDQSDFRRNNPTVHKKWDANKAILSGDAMHIAAYQLIAKCNEKQLLTVIQLFSRTSMEVCEGQQLDMEFENELQVSVDQYLGMIRLKTAVLLGASLKMGGILSKAPEKEGNLLYDFGINLGMIFQLKDDLLDVYGQQRLFGKEIGTDIINNKKTFLLIRAIEKSEGEDAIALNSWISNKQGSPKEKINAVTELFNKLKVREEAEELIKNYYAQALDCLEQIDVEDERKKELYSFAENLIDREI